MVVTAGALLLLCLVAARTAGAQGPEYPLPLPPTPPSFLSPAPVVRLVGRTNATGARITRLSVRSPRGSEVIVRCRGGRARGCKTPLRARLSPASRVLRFRKFERRYKAGVRLQISVRKGNTIGKYVSFKIRKKKAPQRDDACLFPDRTKPSTCPD